MIASDIFAGKRYAVLGLARSGLTAAEALIASGAEVTVWDLQEELREAFAGRTTIADPLAIDLSGFAGVVVSPGVPLNKHPIAKVARDANVPLIGDIELFAMARPALPPHRVIGITGTNGKSTTTALVHHILESAGTPARMAGNIGLPILGGDPLPPGGVYVLELSSYQLDLTHSLACDSAGLLNITPDHLDRYDGQFSAYAASKVRLFCMQRADQFAAFGDGDDATRAIHEIEAARRDPGCAVGLEPDRLAPLQRQWPTLQGPHNLQNAAMAVALVEALGVTREQWLPALGSFRGLAHRMEVLTESHGVLFVNDSKATNPASTAPALAAFPPLQEQGGRKRIHWIVGGLPKGDDLGECVEHFGNVAVAYTIGEAGPKFAQLLQSQMQVRPCEMLCTAVEQAIKAARPGDVVLFSPACASFDQFRDFEARGDAFREIVAELTSDHQRKQAAGRSAS